MIVLDASAAFELLMGTAKGRRVGERIEVNGESMHAPHLLDAEVSNTLRKGVRLGRITAARGKTALAHLRDAVITRYPHDPLLDRMWELRDRASAYDAAYISLAEILDSPIVTCDGRLSRIIGHRATVEMI